MISPELRARYHDIPVADQDVRSRASDRQIQNPNGFPGMCTLGQFCRWTGAVVAFLAIPLSILSLSFTVLLIVPLVGLLIASVGQVMIYLRPIAHHAARIDADPRQGTSEPRSGQT